MLNYNELIQEFPDKGFQQTEIFSQNQFVSVQNATFIIHRNDA